MEKHMITIDNREKITITDVKSVDAFDEEEICAELSEGGLVVKGKQLHIQLLDLDCGNAIISGEIASVSYTQKKSEKNIIKKLLK